MTQSASEKPSEPHIGRYRLLSKLGEGGNAMVYRAELMGAYGFTKTVALKVIKPKKSKKNHPNQVDAFIREARLGGLIRHPHIVDVYELGEHEGHNFISMELIDGWTLSRLLKQQGPFPSSLALQIGRDICKGLSAAHNLKVKGVVSTVVHRDLKPANVMLDQFGTVRVLDFGIALLKSEPALDTSVYGTLAYMAPEQILNKEADLAPTYCRRCHLI